MITIQMIKDRWNRGEVYTKPNFWDSVADKYYRNSGHNLWTNPHLNDIYHRLESEIVHGWAPNVDGIKMLDLGCGAGRFSREFAGRGAIVDAVDFSPKSIEYAHRLSPHPNVTYRVGSVFDLNADAEYDLILCAKVLAVACKDVDDLRVCLKKIHRALKPGGRYISIEMLHTNFVRRVLNMSFADFQKELERAGLEIVETKGAEFIPARMALAFFELPRWFTQASFSVGEFLLKLMPGMSDQKFTCARKK